MILRNVAVHFSVVDMQELPIIPDESRPYKETNNCELVLSANQLPRFIFISFFSFPFFVPAF